MSRLPPPTDGASSSASSSRPVGPGSASRNPAPPGAASSAPPSRPSAPSTNVKGSTGSGSGLVASMTRQARPPAPGTAARGGAGPRPQSNVGARLLKKRQSVAYHPSHAAPRSGPPPAIPAVPSLPLGSTHSIPQDVGPSSTRAPSSAVAGSSGAGSNGVAQPLAPSRTQGENQLFATGLDVDQLASEGFKPEDFLKSSLPAGSDQGAARMDDLRRLKGQVESAMKITESELQRSVFNNYADFVVISKEIATLENEMLELKGVLEEWRTVPESLEGGWGGDDDLLLGGGSSNRRNARNSIADLATLYKSQLSALWEGVEGAQKLLPYTPGRHIIAEASTFVELHSATYKPKQLVHLFLLNDAMLVSVKKRRGPGIGGAVRLVAERCFNLSEIVVVDLKDGGDLQNAVKIKRGKETIIFKTDKAEDKRMLLLAFKKVAEELMNKKRKEMLSEAEARKGDPSGLRNDYDGSFNSSEFNPASILGFVRDDPSGKDSSWIGDYSDELSVAISTRSFEDAVVLVEKGKSILPQLASNSHTSYQLRAKLDARTSELVASLLHDLADPALRKTGVVGTTAWLLRLGQGEHARETFLTARGTLLRKRARQIKFEGDISMYISELAMVCFTLIKNTCEWYMAAFKDNRMASGFVRWASAQVEIYAEIFRRQVYGADQDGKVVQESLEVTKAHGAMLRDVGLDFSFLLDGLLRPPPAKSSLPDAKPASTARLLGSPLPQLHHVYDPCAEIRHPLERNKQIRTATANMASSEGTSSSSSQLTVNIKGPSDVKLSITIDADATVEQLKQAIADQHADFAKDNQRLIFSGRVLKDEQPLASYGVKNGVAIHLASFIVVYFASMRPITDRSDSHSSQVKGAKPAASSSTSPASRGPSEAAGVPSTFGAGQQVMGNPLAPLMNAQYAGQLGGFNPFTEMGINPNDPNYVQNMMNSPEVQSQMNRLLADPAIVDQMIESNPQLQAMGPQVRQIMQSEHFRNFVTNPQAMNNMMQMMGGGAGAGAGGFPPPGAFGFGSGQNANPASGAAGPTNLFNPWASTPSSPPPATSTDPSGTAAPTGAGTNANSATATGPGAFNPFRGFEGATGQGATQAPDLGSMMQNLAQLQQMQQMFGGGAGFGAGGMGSFGNSGSSSTPQVPPEERFATQLEQMQAMGFTDASRNVRALLAAGGNVEAAISYLFDQPQ
ncbi:uncharacterized protein JCM15063_000734 [Sporobolomyces koalae]|uniref:uncharacterized protein n=1 Tax=Sporobolomyces koalae TaxID=500713 RepID=UPI00316DF3FC